VWVSVQKVLTVGLAAAPRWSRIPAVALRDDVGLFAAVSQQFVNFIGVIIGWLLQEGPLQLTGLLGGVCVPYL
jgi:hypothetical protein